MSSIYSFAAAISNQKAKGISAVYVNGTSGYTTLGFIRNGSAIIKSLTSMDTFGREFPHAVSCEYKFEMLQATATEIDLMDSLVGGSVDFIITGVDGLQYEHLAADNSGANVLGVYVKVSNDSSIDKNRFIEVNLKVNIPTANLSNIIKSTPTTITQVAAGTFGAIVNSSTLTGRLAGIVPSGILSVGVRAWGESSSYDTIGRIKNGKWELSHSFEEDDLGRYNSYCVDMNLEFDYLQSTQTEIASFQLAAANQFDYKITNVDGTILYLNNEAGVNWSFENVGNIEGLRVIKVVGKGKIAGVDFTPLFTE